MGLKLIGAGYGRTGTMSVYTALNQVGLPCYHMMEVMKHPGHLDFWLKVARAPAGTQHDWNEIFAGYRAAVDNPPVCVWRELAQAYPEAKVLLTLHPKGPDGWYDSTIETIYRPETMWQSLVLRALVPRMRKFGEMTRKLVWERSHRGTMTDRAAAIARYHAHVQEVKAAIPPERLLIYTADQGWEPLCGFLGIPVPATPFPNVNDRATMKKMMRGMAAMAYVLLAGLALVAVGIVTAVLKIFG